MKKLVVHMIGNAHLDPVWLWRLPAGIDEAIQTCRTACDLLDEYGDLYITRGEAWVHRVIQRIDPELFERIRRHAVSGRWAVVNGWWIQPDCNLPTAASFRMHGKMGMKYFRDNLGVTVTVGYNVDSFGHNAMIPTFLREAGMDSYCFMRPMAHEKELPANLFTWRSPAGDSVTAFRVSGAYTSWDVAAMQRVLDESIAAANRDAGHTMSFYGVGDHGGGPTREQVEWILANRQYRDDVELRLSHPRAFFDAVAARGITLPIVTGELQYHAIGCYSVQHRFKQEMRRTEELVLQAARIIEAWPTEAGPDAARRLEEAWDMILFNQFHDILAGSSIKTAYDDAQAQLGFARTVAQDIIVAATRRRNVAFPPKGGHHLTMVNLSDRRHAGYVEFEPWTGWHAERSVTLVDEYGAVVPSQSIVQEAAAGGISKLLIRADLPPMGQRVVEIRPGASEPVFVEPQSIIKKSGIDLKLSPDGPSQLTLTSSGTDFLSRDGIRAIPFRDTSDTWSHGIDRFAGNAAGELRGLEPWTVFEVGPLKVTMIKLLTFNDSSLVWRIIWRVGDPIIRMRLRVHWKGAFCVLKLVIPTVFAGGERIDGCPGGSIVRPLDEREYPFHDFLALSGGNAAPKDAALAVVTADAYGVDVSGDGVIRLTLLRSPVYAHHDPLTLPSPNYFPNTDQGIHEYEIALVPMIGLSMEAVLDEINRQRQPIWIAESTRGMAPR
jgi:alpha-mannosidase